MLSGLIRVVSGEFQKKITWKKEGYKRDMALVEVNKQHSLGSIVHNWFIDKKFKFQKISGIDKHNQKYVMSISYDEQDVMLYEIMWEININSIKVTSLMTNKQQIPWRINWDEG